MKQKDDETKTEQPVKKKKSKFKIILLLLLVVMLIGGAYAAWYFLIKGNAPPEQVVLPIMTAAPMDFTVNLADTNQRRYLSVTVELGYREEKLTAEITMKVPEIRDAIIDLFRSKTVAEINSSEGTNALRMDIRSTINQRLEAGSIEEVFFTKFVIQ